jgi:hypothetical protein
LVWCDVGSVDIERGTLYFVCIAALEGNRDTNGAIVPVQREVEKRRFPLV